MSHVKSGGVTHFGNLWFGKTSQIDVAPDVHVKVSHASAYDATP
jgi:hypothetical protein